MNQINVTKGNNRSRAEFRDMVVTAGKETNPTVQVKRVSREHGNGSKVLPTKKKSGGYIASVLRDCVKVQTNKYHALIKLVSSIDVLTLAYELIKSNTGNRTLETTGETLDGITKKWLEKLSEEILQGKFIFKPSKRVCIPKKDGANRPLGVANPREKVVQKAIALVLEGIYEKEFSDSSHGFRPDRSSHSALHQIFIGVKSEYRWAIEGEITECYDYIPHKIIMNVLSERIECEKFISLIKRSLQAGYIDPNSLLLVKEKVGIPQGSILSPILCNIVLDKLDKFMEEQKKNENAVPMRGPDCRRLFYVRSAEKFVVTIVGSKADAEDTKVKIIQFLNDRLGLSLNLEKSKVVSLRDGFKFLGADIFIKKFSDIKTQPRTIFEKTGKNIEAKFNLKIIMNAPIKQLLDRLVEHQFLKAKDKEYYPIGVTKMITQDHADILNYFNSVINGIVNYYSFVDNRMCLSSIVRYLRYSCAATLGRKYKTSSVSKMFKRFGPDLKCPKEGTILNIPRSKDLRKCTDFNRFKKNILLEQPEDSIFY